MFLGDLLPCNTWHQKYTPNHYNVQKKKKERKHKPKPGRLSVKKRADVAERLLRWRAGALSEWTPVCAASVSALHQRPRCVLMSRAAARERLPSEDTGPRCLRRSEETSRDALLSLCRSPSRLFHYVMRGWRGRTWKEWRSAGFRKNTRCVRAKGFLSCCSSTTMETVTPHMAEGFTLKMAQIWNKYAGLLVWQFSATITEQTHKLCFCFFFCFYFLGQYPWLYNS